MKRYVLVDGYNEYSKYAKYQENFLGSSDVKFQQVITMYRYVYSLVTKLILWLI